jgi:hypothetical protein
MTRSACQPALPGSAAASLRSIARRWPKGPQALCGLEDTGGRRELDARPAQPASSLSSIGWGAPVMDRLATARKCRTLAARCSERAETAHTDGVRVQLLSTAQMWTKLADETERLQALKAQISPGIRTDQSRLEAYAPRCPQCDGVMSVLLVVPRAKFNEVNYRCPECRAEAIRAVPRAL